MTETEKKKRPDLPTATTLIVTLSPTWRIVRTTRDDYIVQELVTIDPKRGVRRKDAPEPVGDPRLAWKDRGYYTGLGQAMGAGTRRGWVLEGEMTLAEAIARLEAAAVQAEVTGRAIARAEGVP